MTTPYTLILHPSPLRGSAAVVRDGRHVLDHRYFQADGLQRTDGRLAAGAGALHEYVHAAQPMLHRLAGRVLRRDLRRERSALLRAFETDGPRAGPGDDFALHVGHADDRVVERG